MPSAEQIREAQRQTWAGLSVSWDKWDALIMDQLAPAGAAIVEGLGIAADQHHLDIASGTGEPGLTIARLAPQGRVVLTDLAPEMLAVAARRAAEQGVENVESAVCSADDLPFADATFDSVSVRFGFMFFPDLPRATAELVRVLKPGGRLAGTVWIEPEQNPWTSVILQAVATEVDVPAPDPERPHMFRCGAPGLISDLYAAAGLHDVREWEVPLALVTSSPEQYWETMSEHVSLAAAALKQVDAAAAGRIRSLVIDRVRAFEQDGSVSVPGLCRCIVGTK